MIATFRHPAIGHMAIVVALFLSIGVTRTMYLEPRRKEMDTLRGEERKLSAELVDLEAGIEEMDGWVKLHPGQDLLSYRARHALPEAGMVAGFLRAIVPVAERHHVGTELIQPAGMPTEDVVTDASGVSTSYRKVDLRLRLFATYRDLGDYLHDIEAMEQLVVVRSVTLHYSPTTYPELQADVTIWLYGTI